MDNIPPHGGPFGNEVPSSPDQQKNDDKAERPRVKRKLPENHHPDSTTGPRRSKRRKITRQSDSPDTVSSESSRGSSSRSRRSRSKTSSSTQRSSRSNSESSKKPVDSLPVSYDLWKLLFASTPHSDELSEIYDFYALGPDSEYEVPDEIVIDGKEIAISVPDGVKIRQPQEPELSRIMKSKLKHISKKLRLPWDMRKMYTELLKQSLDFKCPVDGETSPVTSELKEKLEKLGKETFDFMIASGVKRYAYDPQLAWPWVPAENLTQEDWYYMNQVNPAINLCQELVYDDDQFDMTLEEKDRLFNKLVALIVHHTKQACCGDSAHVGMNYLLSALEREQLPVRIAFMEMQVFSRDGEEVTYPTDIDYNASRDEDYQPSSHSKEGDSPEEGYSSDSDCFPDSTTGPGNPRRPPTLFLHHGDPSSPSQARTRKPSMFLTPASATVHKSFSDSFGETDKPDEKFSANHIVIAVLPRNDETLKLPKRVTSEDCLHKSEAMIIDPALKIILPADDPDMVMRYLRAFNLEATGRYQFQYTFLY